MPATSSSRIPSSGPMASSSDARGARAYPLAPENGGGTPQFAGTSSVWVKRSHVDFIPMEGAGSLRSAVFLHPESDGGEHGFRGKRPSGDQDLGITRSDRSRPFASRTSLGGINHIQE